MVNYCFSLFLFADHINIFLSDKDVQKRIANMKSELQKMYFCVHVNSVLFTVHNVCGCFMWITLISVDIVFSTAVE